ncbi:hypothetical protein Cri9333_4833 (plasmid) [Crinalium epipsammum PCC 9333]|uniref:TIGR04255 family protein n=1 Tax=Crinalium epipsammum PCC 9333 TaxID=1173022 RepID=K9W734_9CYAN|nr:TIGR04255 family protein [Crinalium epipsammum]AFZ15599.1 hypothetical protein Cri9333_4833 [Crinalium epipsammum PCC 9333]
MNDYPNFKNSPIVEAIFDIRATLPTNLNFEDISLFEESIKDEFPVKNIKASLKADFSFQLNNIPSNIPLSTSKEGFVFSSLDNKKIIQVRLDGFTFSQLQPYDSWDNFYNQACNLWKMYVQVARPDAVSRVALRYINKMEIPFKEPFKIEDYVKIFPEISADIKVTLMDYFMRLVVTNPKYLPSIAIVNQTIGELTENNTLPLIFDIDIYQDVIFSPEEDEGKIKNIFENNLRSFRNEIFFKAITKKTEALFQ